MHRRDAPEQQSTATIALLLLPLLWRSCLATALDSFHLSSALDSRPAHGFAAQRPFASSQRKAVNSCYRRAAHHPVSSSDVPAGPWLSQTWATSLYLPTFVGEAVVAPLFGLFVGRFWAHVTDEELWREHTKRYRAFLYAVTALVTVYALLVVEEACYWGTLQKRDVETVLGGTVVDAILPPLGGLISALVSAALAYRASHLFSSRLPKWIFLGGVGALILTSWMGSLLIMYHTIQFLREAEPSTSFTFNNSITLWMSTSAAADVSISVALWINLRSQVGEGFEVTDSILRTLAHVGLRTAGYTSVVAVTGAALSAFPQNDYRMICAVYATFLPLPCLSCLSLFTTLHSQRTVRDQVTMSFAGNVDSFVVPGSFSDPLSSNRPQFAPFPSRLSQVRRSVQGTEREDWKPDEARREELSVSSSDETDHSPV